MTCSEEKAQLKPGREQGQLWHSGVLTSGEQATRRQALSEDMGQLSDLNQWSSVVKSPVGVATTLGWACDTPLQGSLALSVLLGIAP